MATKFFLLIAFLSFFLSPSLAQFGLIGLLPCLSSLMPCMNFLHEDSPPPSCCLPLESALEAQADCLCTVFQDKQMLAKVNMTQEKMLDFPTKCGIDLPNNNCTIAIKDAIKSPAPNQPPISSKPTPSPPPPSEDSIKSRALDRSPQDSINLMLAMMIPVLIVYRYRI